MPFVTRHGDSRALSVVVRVTPAGFESQKRTYQLPSLFAVHSRAMGVPSEPGQKGVNWSNIAVGERVMS
jgi:hypothetical protein